jgi:phosphatidate phosphatase APP1
MATSSPAAPAHRAARFEDVVHAFRLRLGRRFGMTPTVIPFTGYGSTDWVRVLCRVQLAGRRSNRRRERGNSRGWRSFVAISVGDISVTIIAGTQEIRVNADRGGVVDTTIAVTLEPGWQNITIRVAGDNAVSAPVFIVHPRVSFGIVSDVDDTVMVTALPRPFLAAWNTFVLNEHARSPVPGMAVLYERLTKSHPGTPVIYLSTGAWNVAPTLSRFLGRNLYPPGPLLLTDWGPTHDRWFRSGREHKRLSLQMLASEFPNMSWLLIGDNGQHDEEIYGDFAKEHPTKVAGIAIRQLSTGEAVLAGGRGRAARTGSRAIDWMYAQDGAGLAESLVNARILPAEQLPIIQ